MRVLALGATGFIGPHVVRQLVDEGHEVAVLHRGLSAPDLPPGVHRFKGVRDAIGRLRDDFARWGPDVVVDFIAYTEADARLLVDTFRGVTRHITVLSSGDVYRHYDGFRGYPDHTPDPGLLTEDAPLRERLFPYRGIEIPFPQRDDYEKILVEATLLDCPDIHATVLRLPAVYGPGDPQHRLRPLLMRMQPQRRAVVLEAAEARWRWSRGYVGNVAAAITLAATCPHDADRVFNVADEPALTELEWVERIARLADWDGQILVVDGEELPPTLKQDVDWRYSLAFDTDRLTHDLGFRPRLPPEAGLLRTIAWERSVMSTASQPDHTPEDEVISRFLSGTRPDSL